MGTECASLDLVLLVWWWEEDSGLEGWKALLQVAWCRWVPAWSLLVPPMGKKGTSLGCLMRAEMSFPLACSPGWLESVGLPLDRLVLSGEESIYLTHLLLGGGPGDARTVTPPTTRRKVRRHWTTVLFLKFWGLQSVHILCSPVVTCCITSRCF